MQAARRHERTALRWTVTLVTSNGDVHLGETLDISPGGMSIVVPQRVGRGDVVRVYLDRRDFPCLLPDQGLAPIEGCVVYSQRRTLKPDGPHRIGVSTDHLPTTLVRHLLATDQVAGIRLVRGEAA